MRVQRTAKRADLRCDSGCTGLSRATLRASFVAAIVAMGCASVPRGASEANFAKARERAANGWELYRDNCASCHGQRGESVSGAPEVMGEGALPEYPRERDFSMDPGAGDPESLRLKAQTRPAGAPWRDPFRSAQDLYDFVSKNMPQPAKKAGSLSPEQYWAITNFMLLAHGAELPAEGVTPANASSLKL